MEAVFLNRSDAIAQKEEIYGIIPCLLMRKWGNDGECTTYKVVSTFDEVVTLMRQGYEVRELC